MLHYLFGAMFLFAFNTWPALVRLQFKCRKWLFSEFQVLQSYGHPDKVAVIIRFFKHKLTASHHIIYFEHGPTDVSTDHALLLSCQPRVTVTSCFVYKVIWGLEPIDHLCINPIRIRSYGVYKIKTYLTIVNKT